MVTGNSSGVDGVCVEWGTGGSGKHCIPCFLSGFSGGTSQTSCQPRISMYFAGQGFHNLIFTIEILNRIRFVCLFVCFFKRRVCGVRISLNFLAKFQHCLKKRKGAPGWLSQLSIWLLILTQVIISGLWDQPPCWAPTWVGSLLEILSHPLPPTSSHILSLWGKKKKRKKGHFWGITLWEGYSKKRPALGGQKIWVQV